MGGNYEIQSDTVCGVIFIARKRSCGKVMFSEMFVCPGGVPRSLFGGVSVQGVSVQDGGLSGGGVSV